MQKRVAQFVDRNTYVIIVHINPADYLEGLIDVFEGTQITLQREIVVVLGGIRIDDQLHARTQLTKVFFAGHRELKQSLPDTIGKLPNAKLRANCDETTNDFHGSYSA